MRPAGGPTISPPPPRSMEGQVRVVVTALDENDEFLNFLAMTGTAVGPDLKKPLDAADRANRPGPLRRYVPRPRVGQLFRDETHRAWPPCGWA